ncbi:endonuclease NucS domain-containing protein [Argonema antarcticum]|uniref:endonuclease NucS domain-containing protein n=1 Tax=Argonema antarcticum TaxID=2942763 RepID=UPI002011A0E4|nr:endonuclease NucS domain-containing protein [Argonema antarcticum]MCL1475769.1 endonuclease NucS [Argonema antarcticum A004/B2]
MISYVNLRKTGTGWEFENEAALEDFVWANLTQIFGLTPLKRQHTVKGQFCDILALGENKQLVVLELKNVEDRYVVQQLTRYYHALREEMPFNEEVDYEQPIGLIAIAPSFHRDNFTDRKYNHLSVQFLQFQIFADGEKFYLQLKDVDSNKVWQVEISYQERESNYDNIPGPPRALLNLLSKFSDADSQLLLRMRQKILTFDKRMQEEVESGSISYGKGKSKPCAEIMGKKSTYRKNLIIPRLILWLPISPDLNKINSFNRIGRMIISSKSFPRNSFLSHIDQYSYVAYKPKESRSHSANQYWSIEQYIRLYLGTEEDVYPPLGDIDCINFLVELALTEWLKRL